MNKNELRMKAIRMKAIRKKALTPKLKMKLNQVKRDIYVPFKELRRAGQPEIINYKEIPINVKTRQVDNKVKTVIEIIDYINGANNPIVLKTVLPQGMKLTPEMKNIINQERKIDSKQVTISCGENPHLYISNMHIIYVNLKNKQGRLEYLKLLDDYPIEKDRQRIFKQQRQKLKQKKKQNLLQICTSAACQQTKDLNSNENYYPAKHEVLAPPEITETGKTEMKETYECIPKYNPKQRVLCECGKYYTKEHKARHFRSKVHTNPERPKN